MHNRTQTDVSLSTQLKIFKAFLFIISKEMHAHSKKKKKSECNNEKWESPHLIDSPNAEMISSWSYTLFSTCTPTC